ncbi:hypothetical protein [Mycobacterium sp. Z3061]|uniref:hypothetical protein n=1 Tax=Mycobacterium sp. Z3061 TaxID=3073562 RepID=UPI0028739C94|nr:hypothetical protein [Mycobacterium sp. Z3061]
MLPTLSEINAWDTQHLIAAARHWTTAADQWECVFLQVRNEAHFLMWQGAGGEGLRQRTRDDLSIVSADADQLRQASAIVRDGAGSIGAAHRRVSYAVEDAQNAGFHVGEDLSVTDTQISRTATQQAYRRTQALAFASEIRRRATQLIGIEQQVADSIAAATAGIATTDFPKTGHGDTPRIQAVDQRGFKRDPPPPPGSPGNPFAGWTDEQMAQVATEIAHGHAWDQHCTDFPGMTRQDLSRWIYDTMKDPSTRVATSINSGGIALLRDGKVVFIDPRNPDYGTAFRPNPTPTSKWRTPLEYFEQQTRPLRPIGPPAPGRLPPLTPGVMSPPRPLPKTEPPAAPKSAPPPRAGGAPLLPGGPATPIGPHIVHPPHSIPHHLPILGEDDPWENPRDFE